MTNFRLIPIAATALFLAAPIENNGAAAFAPVPTANHCLSTTTSVSMVADENDENSASSIGGDDRRAFLTSSLATLASSAAFASLIGSNPSPASARVYLDPAMYGDQELRVSAVDSMRESVRRALLQKPKLAPFFFELALLDCLSYDQVTQEGGPDGSVVKAVLAAKTNDEHTAMLRECANVLIESKKNLKKMSSITLADAVALAGAEAVAAVGGPTLNTQLGRTDVAANAPIPSSMPPIDLLAGADSRSVEVNGRVLTKFQKAGLTEREMTALLACLLNIDAVEKSTPIGGWKDAGKAKYVERGKMGRMSDYKKLTDEDIEAELAKDGVDDDDESYTVSGDDGWYIADSFGDKSTRFGKNVSEQDFYGALKKLPKAKFAPGVTQYGWIREFLLSKELPTAYQWVTKYSSKSLIYEKDLKIAYNAATQLGGEYTGGKYESLLKNKKRKTLNDDELKF